MKRLLTFAAALLLYFAATAQHPATTSLATLLNSVPDDSTRYRLLRQAHVQALANGDTLSYKGIDTLRLEIPTGAEPIPLGLYNDFANAVFIVRNNTADLFLFSRTHIMQPIATDLPDSLLCAAIDTGDFTCIPDLLHGQWLLRVVDSTPWVDQRIGHSYGHYREELLLLDSGRTDHRPIMPYSGTVSRPRLFGCPRPESDKFQFNNITLLRDSLSTYKTYLLNIENLYPAYLHNVIVVTPPSNLVNDRIIRIYNCATVTLDKLTLLGSYSRTNHSGYGLLMNNCRKTLVLNLYARSAWGIFGTNNMYYTHFISCDFDRFDIHCYGRNVIFDMCRQQDSYNQFSSVYGNICYNDCTFDNFTPLLIEASYNAYPHFSFEMTDCNWHLTRQRHTLMMAGRLDNENPARPELQEKCLPDIRLSGLSLTAERRVRILTLLHYNGTIVPKTIGGIRHISISDLSGNPLRLQLIDHPSSLALSNKVSLTLPSGSRQLHQFKKTSLSLKNTH